MPTNNHSDNLFDGQSPLDDEQLWDLLSLYVDGEADPTQAAIVERMLSSDPAYRRDFDFLMETSQTIQRVEEVEPPVSLRDAVYSRTTGRPTLAGRLRAAWTRATTPVFGRYATVAGAFAVVALGTAIVWPHPGSSSADTGPAPVAVVTPRSDTSRIAFTNPIGPLNPDWITPRTILKPKAFAPKAVVHNDHVPHDRTPIVQEFWKAPEKIGPRMAQDTRSPRNHPLLKNNGAREGASQVAANGTSAGGYPYNPAMDYDTTHNHANTILPQKADFGPPVEIDETPVTPSGDGGKQVAMAPTSDGNVTPQPTPDAPKPHVRTVTLPPADKQVLAEAVLRKNMSLRNEGYDRSIADNSQRRDVMTLYKSTF